MVVYSPSLSLRSTVGVNSGNNSINSNNVGNSTNNPTISVPVANNDSSSFGEYHKRKYYIKNG